MFPCNVVQTVTLTISVRVVLHC